MPEKAAVMAVSRPAHAAERMDARLGRDGKGGGGVSWQLLDKVLPSLCTVASRYITR